MKVFIVLWSSNDQIKSTLYSSVRKIIFQLHSVKSPIDPSFFLKSLEDSFCREGRSSFDLHVQQDVVKSLKDAISRVGHFSFDLHVWQDVVEVLEVLLEELTSIITSAAYNMKSLISAICHTCHQLNRRHPTYTSSSCPQNFPFSLAKVFEIECFIGSNAPYCNIYSGIRESDSKLSLTSVRNCLIVHNLTISSY